MSKKDLGIRPICINVDCGKEAQFIGYNKAGVPSFRKTCGYCHQKNIVKNNDGKSLIQIIAENAGFSTIKEYEINLEIRKQVAINAGFDNLIEYDRHILQQEALQAGFDNTDRYREWKLAKLNGFDSYSDYTIHKNHQIALVAGFENYSDYTVHKNHQIALDAGFENYRTYNAHKNHQIALDAGFEDHIDHINSKDAYRKYRLTYCENIDGRFGFVCTTNVVWKGMLDVDHKDEDYLNNEPSNLQTLCKCCHAWKSNDFVKKFGKTAGRKTKKKQQKALLLELSIV